MMAHFAFFANPVGWVGKCNFLVKIRLKIDDFSTFGQISKSWNLAARKSRDFWTENVTRCRHKMSKNSGEKRTEIRLKIVRNVSIILSTLRSVAKWCSKLLILCLFLMWGGPNPRSLINKPCFNNFTFKMNILTVNHLHKQQTSC